ncbi:MAG: hypothetical protein IKU42_06130 [Oscillospiraceae bacterium]|nr:hypothetical protein [Oscillospiraceae bacterium]
MKKAVSLFLPMLTGILFFSGCSKIGEKELGIDLVYGVTTFLSLLLLLGYFCVIKKREPWFIFLFSSVAVVNAGYFSLSLSTTLEEALLANRISYLGSVFLPFSMLMIILNITELKYKKWFPGVLCGIGIIVFLIAASPGYLDIYYKEVYLSEINGVTVLEKVYGPLHITYLFYLLSYFSAMVGVIFYANIKRKIKSFAQAVIIAMAVFVNICVWFLEQMVEINFEFLSVSYIISELFLLGLYLVVQEDYFAPVPLIKTETETETKAPKVPENTNEEIFEIFLLGKKELTPTEKMIYNFYLEGKSTKEIMEHLNIKENTLKYHNKNIYSKLGVSSRKQLVEIANLLNKKG